MCAGDLPYYEALKEHHDQLELPILQGNNATSQFSIKIFTRLLFKMLISGVYKFYSFKWISIQGTKYKVGCIVWIGIDEEEMPKFAQVKAFVVLAVQQRFEDLWFITEELSTTSFNPHVNAYEISPKEDIVLLKQHLLPYTLPLHLIRKDEGGINN